MKASKFSDIIKGSRAVTRVQFPLVCAPTEERPHVEIGIRVLSGAETAEIIQNAIAFATARDEDKPKPGDSLYELGIRVHTLLLACVDPDAADPDSEDARFFSSIEEILGAHQIGRDGIWFLYECQECWQDTCSPQPPKMSEGEFWGTVTQLAANNDPLVCERMRPALRASFMLSMARQLLVLLQHKSDSGWPSQPDTSTSSDGSPKPKASGAKPKTRRAK